MKLVTRKLDYSSDSVLSGAIYGLMKVGILKSGVSKLPLIKVNSDLEDDFDDVIFTQAKEIITQYNSFSTKGEESILLWAKEAANSYDLWVYDTSKLTTFFEYYVLEVSSRRSLTEGQSVELMDALRFLLYLPTLVFQGRKQKLIVSFNKADRTPIYRSINYLGLSDDDMYLFVGKGLMGSKLSKTDFFKSLSKKDLLSFRSQGFIYFIFPLSVMPYLLNETDLDMVPTLWLSPLAFETGVKLPQTKYSWLDLIKYVKQNRLYVLPEEGVDVVCENCADIESIKFRERYFRDRVLGSDPRVDEANSDLYKQLIALVKFKNGAEDFVVVNLPMETVIASACGDVLGRANDPVVNVVMEAYRGLTCVRKVEVTTDPLNRVIKRVRQREKESSNSDKPRFVYLPRVQYIRGSGLPITPKEVKPQVRKKFSPEISGLSKAPHSVSAHLRKGNPSKRQLDEARRLGIVLPEGYTFVRGYLTGAKRKAEVNPQNKVFVFRPEE